jgi:hypothetical protein
MEEEVEIAAHLSPLKSYFHFRFSGSRFELQLSTYVGRCLKCYDRAAWSQQVIATSVLTATILDFH